MTASAWAARSSSSTTSASKTKRGWDSAARTGGGVRLVAQGDTHNIRGLLGMLGEMFREQGLAEREVGELITLDQVYEVQRSALDINTSNTMVRVLTHCAEQDLELAARCAKAVVLL